MINTIILSLGLCLCIVALFFVWQRQQPVRSKRDENLAQLEEVLRTAQLTNNCFFQSLEMVQKNLESLLARAESAEQRMRNLMLQPGGEKRDRYTAAALLLDEGQEPHRVAAMLNLPLPQVEIVQQLHRMASKEKKPAPRNKRREEENLGRNNSMPTKIAARREKSAQPVLLADLLKKAANDSTAHGASYGPFTGIKA